MLHQFQECLSLAITLHGKKKLVRCIIDLSQPCGNLICIETPDYALNLHHLLGLLPEASLLESLNPHCLNQCVPHFDHLNPIQISSYHPLQQS